MKLNEYIKYDGLGLAELIRNREVSATEVTDCARQAIDSVNPQINSIIEQFPAPLSANQSPDAPFQGVPFLIKDLALHAKGVLNEFGSRLAQGIRFNHDTELMKRFRTAGLQTMGRTATPEFGYCATTEPIINGPSRNPWDLKRMPGGSSGASSAAVAAGIVPLAHANDGGGSIRIPAACCGLVGLKPTRGRVSPGPDSGEPLSGLAVDFAVTRSVRDAAALLDAVHGHSPGDPYIIAPPQIPYLQQIRNSPQRLKIAYTSTSWSGSEVDADLKSAVEKTAAICEQSGHEITEATPEFDWQDFFQSTVVYWAANLAVIIDMVATATGRKPDETTLEATTLACYRHGKDISAGQLLRAQGTANHICRSVGAFFEEYDLLLTPTTARPALPVGTLNANDASLDALSWSEHVFDFCPFTPLFNTTGQPAISLPLQRTAADLPLGMQFAGRFGDEATLLQLAAQLEEAAPWPRTAPLIQ